MNLLLVQKEGVDLYKTLLASETSRRILRFYRPDRVDYGIFIKSGTLGSVLSLVSELNWYIRRYVSIVLLEISEDLYCTLSFAQDIYEREQKPNISKDGHKIVGMKNGSLSGEIWVEAGSSKEKYPDVTDNMDYVLEVLCSEWEISCDSISPEMSKTDKTEIKSESEESKLT